MPIPFSFFIFSQENVFTKVFNNAVISYRYYKLVVEKIKQVVLTNIIPVCEWATGNILLLQDFPVYLFMSAVFNL